LIFWILFHQGKSFNISLPKAKSQISLWLVLPTNHLSISLAHSRGGPSSFPVAEKNQNATAASDAMKGSAKARVVIAAPAKAEET
jgi:hypothetical protein